MFRSEYADVPPVEPPLHDAVPARAAEFGDTPALIDGTDGTTLSYEQADRLHRRAAALEALLLTHPGIADAAVIGTYGDDGNELPHAFVVRRPSAAELTVAEIMTCVAERVAPHKRIRHVTFTVGVPRAASGKILRRQLREST